MAGGNHPPAGIRVPRKRSCDRCVVRIILFIISLFSGIFTWLHVCVEALYVEESHPWYDYSVLDCGAKKWNRLSRSRPCPSFRGGGKPLYWPLDFSSFPMSPMTLLLEVSNFLKVFLKEFQTFKVLYLRLHISYLACIWAKGLGPLCCWVCLNLDTLSCRSGLSMVRRSSFISSIVSSE